MRFIGLIVSEFITKINYNTLTTKSQNGRKMTTEINNRTE